MTDSRPLAGWRVLVTRASEQASALSERLREEGAEPIEVATIEIVAPTDEGAALADALGRLESFEWVAFTSVNAVRAVLARLGDPGRLGRRRVAAVGRATAEALSRAGVDDVLIPERPGGAGLAAAFPQPRPEGAGVLLPQAAKARPELARGLRSRGYRVETVVAYETVPLAADDSLRALVASCEAALLTSPSALESFLSSYGRHALPPRLVTIGPTTSARAHELGCAVAAEADEASPDGLVRALSRLALAERPVRPPGLR